MDAKELTLVVNNQSDKINELEKQVKYLTQELEKQRLLMDDMKIDVCNVRVDTENLGKMLRKRQKNDD
jgi:hypothetical protein